MPSSNIGRDLDQEQNSIMMNMKSIIYLTSTILYLSICTVFSVSSNHLKSQNPYLKNLKGKQISGQDNEYCQINTNRIIRIFCLTVLLPTLLLRIHGHFRFKNGNMPTFGKAYFSGTYIFFHGCYGIWSIYNITRFMLLPNVCKQLDYLSVINY